MDSPVNAKQLQVLRWIACGCPPDTVPSPTYKTTAVALQNRGLATVDRRRGKWDATLTETGQYYVEHWVYPPAGPKPEPPLRSTKSVLKPTLAQPPRERRRPPSKPPELPLATQIRDPHPAVKALIANRERIDAPPTFHRRVQLISHTLVQEALRRGWNVEGGSSSGYRQSWKGGDDLRHKAEPLFAIDAGDCAVGIHFMMKMRRIDHVKTPKEIQDAERFSYSYAPRYDYLPTGFMRLSAFGFSYSPYRIEDTPTRLVEARLMDVIRRVERSSAEKREHAEKRARRAAEQHAAQEIAHKERQLANDYRQWEQRLWELHQRWQRHTSMREFVTEFKADLTRVADANEKVVEFAEWADGYLDAMSPFRRINMPRNEMPLMGHDDFAERAISETVSSRMYE